MNIPAGHPKRLLFYCIIVTCLPIFLSAQVTRNYTGSGTFTVPAGVTSVQIRAWGAGGAGGSTTSNGQAGGGGGGAFSSGSVNVTPGLTYPVTVGTGGVAGTNSGSGASTSFNTNSIVAVGGNGVATNSITGAAGGSAAASVGTLKYSGGNGANASGGFSGGGGGGAGSTGNGANALGVTGGAATLQNGGRGSDGVSLGATGNGANGNAGSNYGGGGGGSSRLSTTNRTGGTGASGYLQLDYTCPTYSLNTTSATVTTIGQSASVTVSSTAAGLPIGTYTVTYSLSGAQVASGLTASMTVNAAGSGTFNTVIITNAGTTTLTVTSLSSGVSPSVCTTALNGGNTASFTPFIRLFSNSGTFTIPSGVSCVRVEAWGAGGGGATRTSFDGQGGGGGGGAYASSSLIVTPGTTYTVTVGAGGVAGVAGGNSSFGSIVVAAGGGGVNINSSTGASGGSINNSIGTIRYAGGNGANASGGYSGGGGGGAGSNGNGGNANGRFGGSGTAVNGGNGGDGVQNDNNGNPGFLYGGGGSGASRDDGTEYGGDGADGFVQVSWINLSDLRMTIPASACAGSSIPVTINSTTLLNGTYSFTYSVSGANSIPSATALVTLANGVGSFTLSGLSNTGANTVTILSCSYSGVNCGVVPVYPVTASIITTNGNTITLATTSGTAAQSVCTNSVIDTIAYTTTGATGISSMGLPTGVTATWSNNQVIITGAPTAAGSYNYTITLTGGCGTASSSGTISVQALNTITLTSGNPSTSVCIGTAMIPLVYATTGATGAHVTGLPSGIQATWASNQLVISGTPTVIGSFPFIVNLAGGCGTSVASGTISVSPVLSYVIDSLLLVNTPAIGSPVNIRLVETGLPNGTYILRYSMTGANPVAPQNVTITATSGVATFVAAIINSSGTTYFNLLSLQPVGYPCPGIVTGTTSILISIPQVLITSSGTFVVPVGVNCIKVEAWGAGGGGASRSSDGVGGGGGGGAYASSVLSVSSGNTFGVTVGTGGTPGNAGGATSFGGQVVAAGGNGVATNISTGASGGTVASSIGTIRFPGGNGATGGNERGGGGGGAAGSSGIGSPGNGRLGGAGAPVNGIGITSGNGGDGSNQDDGNGFNGLLYGGGGGGASRDDASNTLLGGNGANGAIRVSWIDPTDIRLSMNPVSCVNSISSVTVNSSTLADGTYVVTYNLSGASAGTATSTLTMLNGSGSFATTITNSGSTTLTLTQIAFSGGSCVSLVPSMPTVTTTSRGLNTIQWIAGSSSVNAVTCVGASLAPIQFVTAGATGAQFTGLPAGVTGSWSSDTIRISGTSTVIGTFSYTVLLTGGCGAVTTSGTLTVNPGNTVSLTSSVGTNFQYICLGNPILPITYATTIATGANFIGLPAGVNGSWANNTITIAGTPADTGRFAFSVNLTGGCGAVTSSGILDVDTIIQYVIDSVYATNPPSVGNPSQVSVYGSDIFNGSYTLTYSITGNNTLGPITVPVIFTNGVATFTTPVITTAGTNIITIGALVKSTDRCGSRVSGDNYALFGINSVTFPLTGTFTVPSGVSCLKAEAWGAGGGGGTATVSHAASGGGGGGAYAANYMSVTAGQSIGFTVGFGGNPGIAGGATSLNNNSLRAAGGNGAVAATATGTSVGGSGGSSANSIGQVIYTGGNGGAGTFVTSPSNLGTSGGGGGGAGSIGQGKNATANIPGDTTSLFGGRGGSGAITSNSTNGNAGQIFGGGGSGAINHGTIPAAGRGANGLIRFSWIDPASFSIFTNANYCQGSSGSVTFVSTTLTSGTYVLTYNLSGANTVTGLTATASFSGTSGTFNTIPFANLGLTTIQVTGIALQGWTCSMAPASNSAVFQIVNNSPPSVSIISSVVGNTICENTPITFTAVTTNTGTVSSYQWKLNGLNAGSNSPTFTIGNLTSNATVSLVINATNLCSPVVQQAISNTIAVSVIPNPTPANAGIDQQQCGNGSFNLLANTPVSGVGSWSLVSGTATLSATNTPGITVTGIPVGTSAVLRWRIVGAPCAASSDDITLTNLSAPQVTANLDSIQCYGDSGQVTVLASGGRSPYSGTGAFTVAAGNYQYTVTDANSCSVGISVIVPQPSALNVSATLGAISCNSTSAILTVSATGGVSPYSGTGVFSLSDGSHSYTVTDANGCSFTGSVNVQLPVPLSLSVSTSTVSQFGACDGDLATVVSGGTSPYTYLWNNGSTSAQPSGLCAGTYAVTVTDASGCTSSGTGVVSSPGCNLNVTLVEGHPTCFGASNGSLEATVSGGTGPYHYSWSNGITVDTSSVSGLPAGTYTVTVVDAFGCVATTTAKLIDPTQVYLVGVAGKISCTGDSALVHITASGGTAPYQGIGDYFQFAGTTSYTVLDANGCSASIAVTLFQPSALVLSTSSSSVSAPGASDGSASVLVSGGSAPYTYSWNTGSTSSALSGLPTGTYSVTVTDRNGCMTMDSVVVTDPACNLTLIPESTPVLCHGGSTGTASVSVSSSGSVFTYSWSDGSTSSTISGLVAGDYQVTVSDGAGCSGSATVTVAEPSPLVVDSMIYPPVNCAFESTFFTAYCSGGTGPYSFYWSCGGVDNISDPTYDDVVLVFINDANGCYYEDANGSYYLIVVPRPPAFSLNGFTSIPTSTISSNDGEAIPYLDGGTSPFHYQWSNGDTTAILSGVPAGDYSLTVTDANGCSVSGNVTINSPVCSIYLELTATDNTCPQASAGTITSAVSGNQGAVSYSWSNGAVSADLIGLPSGVYTLTVTDQFGCANATTVSVNDPADPLTVDVSYDSVRCYGGTTLVHVSAHGGVTPYFGITDTSLQAGTHVFVITDSAGCSLSDTVIINQPDPVQISSSITPITCYGGTGFLTWQGIGGTPPYYGTGSMVVVASPYVITITDANGCLGVDTIDISEPTQLSVSLVPQPVSGPGEDDGALFAVVTGGTPPYTYLWSDGSTNDTLSELYGGLYSITVTDVNGCQDQRSSLLSTFVCTLDATIFATNVTCNGFSDGTVSVQSTGGNGPVSYLWSNGGTGSSISGLAAGNYSVVLTDSVGCNLTMTSSLSEPLVLSVTSSLINISCSGDSASVVITASGGTPPYLGDTTYRVPPGNYLFYVYDANNCSSASGIITLTGAPPLVVSLTADSILCHGDSSQVTISLSGGLPPYSGEGTYSVAAGLHDFLVMDGNGCSDTVHLQIGEPEEIITTISLSDCDSVVLSSGQSVFSSGSYTTTYTNYIGCDSTVVEVVQIHERSSDTLAVSSCGSYVLPWGDTASLSGIYPYQSISSVGCDSTIVVDLTIQPVTSDTTLVQACSSYTWSVDGQTYSATGNYSYVAGCHTSWLFLDIQIPPVPSVLCYETASFNPTTCQWEVTGQQPVQPTLACYETASFNPTICQWEVTGQQPAQPTLACYETATFNATTCQWEVTGQQPIQPTLACYETGSFNATTCQWEVTGSPAAPIVNTVTACQSYYWPVSDSTYTSSGIYSYSFNCQDYALDLTINPCTYGSTLHLVAFLEGYYLGSGVMNSALLNSGVLGATVDQSDSIRLQLRDSLDPTVVIDDTMTILMTDGTASVTFSRSIQGTSYWIVLMHRSSIQTWSAMPVTMDATASYDFTNSDAQAFANNMKEVEAGVWAIYSGDMNQDEFVDPFDFLIYNDDNLNFAMGYYCTDLNGDGFVDPFDFDYYNLNNLSFVMSIHP